MNCRPETYSGAVELAQFGVAKEDRVHFLIHLFKSDLLVTEDLAQGSSALMPANASAVVHAPSLERFGYSNLATLRET